MNSCNGYVYLDASIFDIRTTFLLDTGASMNLVSEDFVRKHNLLYLVKNATFKLVGITGMPLQVIGVIRGAHVIIKGTVFEIDLVVTSKMKE